MKKVPGLWLLLYGRSEFRPYWFRPSFPYSLLAGCLSLVLASCVSAQPLNKKTSFSRQDYLRGSLNPYRNWWNVLRYDLSITPDYKTRTITGKNEMTIEETSGGHTMQIDLQQPMVLDSILFEGRSLSFNREENVYWIFVRDSLAKYKISPGPKKVTLFFHGKPVAAKNPPWDGGWIWRTDARNRPWMSVACQGLGASVWYPCKDHQSDEPDKGASISLQVPDSLVAVANGKLIYQNHKNGTATYTWEVNNPINNYNIVPYIGKYVQFQETFKGEKGELNCSYWVLDYNLDKAKEQFKQAPMTLKAMEHWFGAYPFYEDGFKLVESPHLGMEHQSAVAYGNRYQNGYLGMDLSGTGVGKLWDFIIVHEVGHEWFGNNITSKDIADMWLHEGFTSYSEVLFTEYHFGKQSAESYVQGIRKNIDNDKTIIGHYGVNQEGSGDMYYKGSNLIHTIRQIINDDKKFRDILRGMNREFYHQTVTTRQIEEYISKKSGRDLSPIFEQYLRTKDIPVLELKRSGSKLEYRWTNCIPNFNMPVKLTNGQWIHPTHKKQSVTVRDNNVDVDKNFYVTVKEAAKGA